MINPALRHVLTFVCLAETHSFRRAAERLHLSARAFHRVLRVARTIADLEGSEGIISVHVAEALGYRPRTEDALVARAAERSEVLESAATS